MARTKNFRQLLKRSLLLEKSEIEIFDQIPEEILQGIFEHNFNGNMNTAERVLFNRYGKVQQIETEKLEKEKLKIENLVKATSKIVEALNQNRPILFITDNDNDGSLSQAVLIEFLKLLPEDKKGLLHIEFAQPIGASRGLTYEIIEKSASSRGWSKNEDFLIITADNGINNRSEQEKILNTWKNVDMIVTDHHLPSETVVVESDRTIIFNPKNKPTEYFKHKNISGANTLGVLMSQAFIKFTTDVKPPNYKVEWKAALNNIKEIGYWANLLDYAEADLADMPTKPYTIERAVSLRPLLNVSNSMANIITGKFSDELLEKIAESTENAITKEWLKEQIEDVSVLNILAQKLLSMYKDKQENGISEIFYDRLAEEISKADIDNSYYKSINPNYIEQLRPIIFNLAAIDEKDHFDTLLADNMTQIFQTLRKKERIILDKLREVDLLNQDRLANSSMLYPINKYIPEVFNRKLLGKAYNQDNNGFMLILNELSDHRVSGSMRTLYPISTILEGKDEIESKHNVSLSFQGHQMAAGFFIETKDKSTILTAEVLEDINRWIDNRILKIKEKDYINQMQNIEIDFTSVGVITKVNAAVKANLAGMWGVPAIIKFSPDADNEVWITDNKTTKQVNLKDIVREKKYGYQPIATDLHGGAFIVPIELLRTVVNNNFESGLRLSYLNEGAFMANQVVSPANMPNLVPVMSKREGQKDLVEYYKKTYKDSNFIPLTRDAFKELPYFKYNKYGEKEFNTWENLIITMLDKSKQDILAVIDTEGTGLGKAPKCFNLGGTNIKIDENSGTKMNRDEFSNGFYRTSNGYDVLLNNEQLASLIELDEDENLADFNIKKTTVIYKSSLKDGLSGRFIYPGNYKELTQVSNIKDLEDSNEVLINRKINGFAFAYLIKGDDFAITKDFENLTNISQGMLNEVGVSADKVDRDLVEYYENLKNSNGEKAKVIFQAHNMPYDKGVVSANFQLFNRLMENNIISDTAKIARMDKLAYDDTPVCSFDNVVGIPPKVYFYDSPYSDYSMTTFLERVREGKGGVFPDIKSKFLLRYNEETKKFSFIDREKNDEFMLDVELDDLYNTVEAEGNRVIGELPNNAVKYSVERLSIRSMVRNILLNEDIKVQRLELSNEEKPFSNLLAFFQDNYHFDDTAESNLQNFYKSMLGNDAGVEELFAEVEMEEFTQRFLEKNKKIQAKFHDGWIYEKVLDQYEPTQKDKNITKDVIEQINYQTDLPSSKIRQVISDVVAFNTKYGINNAIVHEEHNNIKHHSEDGSGLSDTSYEAVLPQLLGLMKHYNPYYHSVEAAAKEMIDKNMKGAMVQTALKNVIDGHIARDSFSMKQMVAFNRDGKSDLIKRAEDVASGANYDQDQGYEEIKFKLKTDTLPPGSAIYAKPRRHLSQEEVYEASEKLNFILVNEQVKDSAANLAKLDTEVVENIHRIVEANDAKAIQYRDELLQDFTDIQFSRKESEFKKMATIFKDIIETEQFDIGARTKITDEMMLAADFLTEEFKRIVAAVDPESHVIDLLDDSLEKIKAHKADQIKKEIEKQKKELAKQQKDIAKGIIIPEEEPVVHTVRQENFLNELGILRREPLKFLLDNGIDFCLPYIKKVVSQNEERNCLDDFLPKISKKSFGM